MPEVFKTSEELTHGNQSSNKFQIQVHPPVDWLNPILIAWQKNNIYSISRSKYYLPLL